MFRQVLPHLPEPEASQLQMQRMKEWEKDLLAEDKISDTKRVIEAVG